MTTIRKVLIANRGEIAVRVMRAAKARGLATVAVYSDADANALHVRLADEAVRIGPAEAAQSYLRIDAIIEAAKRVGADAIHPGYGFLSERAAFAEACETNGLVFIGPPASAIAAMGDKAESKRRMIAAGVPSIPGYQDEDQSDARLMKEAARIGFPAMLKASAGGGGRGQRVVYGTEDLGQAIASARRESESAFGDGRLIIERAIVGARHVEIQVMADAHGNVIHLGERDCSLQRRRQKVIEEAPSPAIAPELRERMGEAAVEAARAVGYRNAGTVEFLFDPQTNEFYFLEMNTRLQVEHPVTELVTGLDLVAMQFDIAEGKPLPIAQKDVKLEGAAIEARLYAEDPSAGFLPHSGKIAVWREPKGVRVDSGVEEGDSVTTFYDPMVAKIIAHGATRDEARIRLAAALKHTVLLGLGNNRDFLIELLEDPAFAKGEAATDYIEANLDRLTKRRPPGGEAALALVAAALVDEPFDGLLTGWNSRGASTFPLHVALSNGTLIKAEARLQGRRVEARHGAELSAIDVISKTDCEIVYVANGRAGRAFYARNNLSLEIDAGGAAERYLDFALAPATEAGAGADVVKAPMAGAVTSVAVKPGDAVIKGRTVATIEAMKMEHQLKAPRDGVVAEVLAKIGDQVAIRAKVVTLKSEG
ncbi:MAG: acetyl/propionyl/methylcrotonyl-CoA carboxylase subunit alpha [Pseudomonadota bacterium]